MWQIERRCRDDITFEEWVSMDLAYLEDWWLQDDLLLMLRTPGAVARMTGE